MAKQLPKNYSDQLNSNNSAFWKSRGYPERPSNWQEHPAQPTPATSQPKPANPPKK
jgi:hypothetical protein